MRFFLQLYSSLVVFLILGRKLFIFLLRFTTPHLNVPSLECHVNICLLIYLCYVLLPIRHRHTFVAYGFASQFFLNLYQYSIVYFSICFPLLIYFLVFYFNLDEFVFFKLSKYTKDIAKDVIQNMVNYQWRVRESRYRSRLCIIEL